MKLKSVFRWDGNAKLLRLFRVIWRRGEGPGRGGIGNYDAKLSVALCRPWKIGWDRGLHEWALCLFGLRVHYQRSYGGCMT